MQAGCTLGGGEEAPGTIRVEVAGEERNVDPLEVLRRKTAGRIGGEEDKVNLIPRRCRRGDDTVANRFTDAIGDEEADHEYVTNSTQLASGSSTIAMVMPGRNSVTGTAIL